MSLTDLPHDILGSILAPKDVSPLSIRLWKTGNKLLMSRLASGLTNLDLRPIASTKEFRMPSMVSEMRNLRHFSLFASGITVTNPSRWSSMLKMLPQRLETIETYFFEMPNIFLNCGPESDIAPDSAIETQYLRGLSHCIDLESMFPNLLSLKCLSDYPTKTFNATDLLPALPSSLTMLDLGEIYHITFPFASLLPKSLRRLEGTLHFEEVLDPNDPGFINDWLNAPPNLQRLGNIICPRAPDQAAWMPKSLTSVGECVFETFDPTHPPTFTTTAVQELHVSMSGTFPQWPQLLPRHATSLCFGNELEPSEVALLPSTVTNLTFRLSYPHWQEIEANDGFDRAGGLEALRVVWPSNLSTLWFDSGDADPVMLLALPHTLVELHASFLWVSGPVNLNHLPPLLRSFQLESDASLIGKWPTGLDSITLSHKSSFVGCPAFPPSLTSFAWHMIMRYDEEEDHLEGMDDEPLLLPCPHLIKLDVAGWHSAWFPLIPQSVTDLRINNLTLSVDSNEDDSWPLPPGLTRLDIGRSNEECTLSSGTLSSLPLLNCIIAYEGMIDSSAIQCLPREMQILYATITPLSPSDLLLLPPTLTECRLELDWTVPKIADYWPPRFARFIRDELPDIKNIALQRLFDLDL